MKIHFSLLTTMGVLSGACLLAQDGSWIDLFTGYSFLRADPAQNIAAFPNDGGVASAGVNFNNNFALEFDFGGYYNGNVNQRGVELKSFTSLLGPRFSFGRSNEVDPFFHVLFGAVSTSGAKFVAANGGTASPGARIDASEHNFAMAAGGGVDIRMTKAFLLRPIQLDYVLTRLEDLGFSGQPTQNRNQHNLRVSIGLVFQFGGAR